MLDREYIKAFTNIRNLPESWAVVDMDTGTVLGTNLLIIPWPDNEDEQEDILNSDSDAFDYANHHGKPLYIDTSTIK